MVDKKKTRLLITIICLAFTLWGIIFFSTSDSLKHSEKSNKPLESNSLKTTEFEKNQPLTEDDDIKTLTEVTTKKSAQNNASTTDTEKKLMQTINQHFNQVEKNDLLRSQAEQLEQEVKRKIQSLNKK